MKTKVSIKERSKSFIITFKEDWRLTLKHLLISIYNIESNTCYKGKAHFRILRDDHKRYTFYSSARGVEFSIKYVEHLKREEQ